MTWTFSRILHRVWLITVANPMQCNTAWASPVITSINSPLFNEKNSCSHTQAVWVCIYTRKKILISSQITSFSMASPNKRGFVLSALRRMFLQLQKMCISFSISCIWSHMVLGKSVLYIHLTCYISVFSRMLYKWHSIDLKNWPKICPYCFFIITWRSKLLKN